MANEYYRPQPMDADSLYHVKSAHMAGFLAVTAGTITISDRNPVNGATVPVVIALPVAVGFNRIPLTFQTGDGADVQLAGGASGSLLI